MKQSTARQPHNYTNSDAERYAFYRRRDHANMEAMINLIIASIAGQTDLELPPKCRHLLSAIQGAHGGGEVVNVEFERDYLTLAAQLQFSGKVEAQRSRVRAWIDAFEEWQIKTYLLVTVIKGGKVVGYEDDGTPICTTTKFIDHLLPVADEAVQRARASVQWRGDAKQNFKSHPGLALAAQVEWAVKQLSRHPEYKAPDEVEDAADDPGEQLSPADKIARYVAGRQVVLLAEHTRVLNRLKEGEPTDVDEIDARLASLDVYFAHVSTEVKKGYTSAREQLLRLRETRLTRAMDFTDPEDIRREVDEQIAAGIRAGATPPPTELDSVDTYFAEGEAGRGNGNASTWEVSIPAGYVEVEIDEGGGTEKHTQSTPEMPVKTQDSDPEMLEWAIEWARQGVPVFPVHSAFDGICSCSAGSECKSTGKHPKTAKGLKEATTDEAQIAAWWRKWPHANIGGRMGGAVRLLAVDVDPRHGGDASLFDLTEAHGGKWLETRHVETGSRGSHFFFTYPEGIELRNTTNNLAPGIDTRAEGGYVVLPPSLHVSGRRYTLKSAVQIQPAPAWLVEELTRPADQKPPVVVNFQERRTHTRGGGIIGEGERNARMFKIGCAIWGKGQAQDLTDLHMQLLQVNAERCSPLLTDAEVAEIVGSINRYPRGVPVPAEAYT